MLSASAVANVITMLAVLYIAFGTPNVYVSDGVIDAHVRSSVDVNVQNQVDIRDRTPVRVEVVR